MRGLFARRVQRLIMPVLAGLSKPIGAGLSQITVVLVTAQAKTQKKAQQVLRLDTAKGVREAHQCRRDRLSTRQGQRFLQLALRQPPNSGAFPALPFEEFRETSTQVRPRRAVPQRYFRVVGSRPYHLRVRP